MILGILLASGDSFSDMRKSGQDVRFKKFYLSKFAQDFNKVYVFTYANEKITDLPKNVILIPNKWNLHRYIYAVLLPFLNLPAVLKCNTFRVYHLSGTIPAILTRIFLAKPFIFNYAYDYKKFAEIENKKLQKFFFSAIEPFAIFFASKIFAANKTILRKIGKKAIYLPNGVDTSVFKPAKTNIKNAKPVIISVGRLEKQKNFESLVGAMKALEAKLIIVGQGSLKSELIQLAKEHKVDLRIVSRVENTKMPQMYQSSDVFVSTSKAEGSPKALLEAMSCGLPVITLRNDGALDISPTSVIFSEENNLGLKKDIIRLIKNNDLTYKLKDLARREILTNYNLNKLLPKEIAAIKDSE